ncbi:ABC transporter ATP-binding protein [Fertoebacter nigrum]|uniref:ABC transporter ATP-binding protein n=1 Tax=Fertoeibacter niger TaxID=2656921 RepID=A0A8X8KMK3_9RHOB|nr:ABC transporter ATP-binding protein [Fertoeibacter niger]NUB46474.1 ABC transporter ATP-binding protein [Fertoeibacter niger]
MMVDKANLYKATARSSGDNDERALLVVRDLRKYFGDPDRGSPVIAIDSVNFEVKRGDFLTLLGPSGCGKSTTLQCIAGLQHPSSGQIDMDGEIVFSDQQGITVPANKRKLGMVFQSYAIWPHMTVFDNVAFPLVHGSARVPSAEVKRRVMEALELVELDHLALRYSPHLSGGQQQRVALARALVHQPKLLLLDEPLSNLDVQLRDTMRVEIRQLVKQLGITTVFVTHDQAEAMSMSDEIVLMQSGRIMQKGTPRQIFLCPKSRFAADFMGRSNLIPAALNHDGTIADTPFGQLRCNPDHKLAPNSRALLVIRPQAIVVPDPEVDAVSPNTLLGEIRTLSFLGETVEIDLGINGHCLKVMADPYLSLSAGQVIRVVLPPERCLVVPDPDASDRTQAAVGLIGNGATASRNGAAVRETR